MAATAGYPNVCDLECTDKNKATYGNRHEFVGPVKIVLVESAPIDYKRKVWGSAIFTFVLLLMGATVFTVFFFTLKFKLPFAMNVHVLLCTMGFQLFMTTGIMMFSTLFGGSMHLKPTDRKFQHFFLEVSAVLIGTVGTAFSFEYMAFTPHAVAGIFSAFFSILSCFVGPTVYTESEKLFGAFNKKAHRNISVFTFILCTVCFCLGFMKSGFMKWAPVNHLDYILLIFTIVCAISVLVSALQ